MSDPDRAPMESAALEWTTEHRMLFVQALRGAPASVLLALAMTQRSMSHQELALWTRCGKNQVSQALQMLVRHGWVEARTTRGPWSLRRRLPVPALSSIGEGNPFKGLGGGGDPLNLTIEETLLPSPRRRELLEAMQSFGIREPTASELADLPHVTPEYLRLHVEGVRLHGLGVGAAITAMRLGAPPPGGPQPRSRQEEVAEKIRRFVEGR